MRYTFFRDEVADYEAHDDASTMVRIKLQDLKNVTFVGTLTKAVEGGETLIYFQKLPASHPVYLY